MRKFFAGLGEKFRTFMIGRYGYDEFYRFLNIVWLIFLVLSLFRIPFTTWISLAVLIYMYFRVFSKNFSKRYAENEAYKNLIGRFMKSGRINKQRFEDRKDYRYFKCPGCGQTVRVPKGKGHIKITCPKCRSQFERNV